MKITDISGSSINGTKHIVGKIYKNGKEFLMFIKITENFDSKFGFLDLNSGYVSTLYISVDDADNENPNDVLIDNVELVIN